MWWGGGGSKKGPKSRKRAAPATSDEDEVAAFLDPQFPFNDLDLSEDDELQPRSLDESDPSPLELRDDNEEAIRQFYFKHCLPTIDQIVERARQVRSDYSSTSSSPSHSSHSHTPLTRILLLSNGWPSFLLELAHALSRDGWEVVDPDEGIRKGMDKDGLKDVDVAVDMALAQRAEVFLGNGFSTLSANVVLLRMGDGVEGFFVKGAAEVGQVVFVCQGDLGQLGYPEATAWNTEDSNNAYNKFDSPPLDDAIKTTSIGKPSPTFQSRYSDALKRSSSCSNKAMEPQTAQIPRSMLSVFKQGPRTKSAYALGIFLVGILVALSVWSGRTISTPSQPTIWTRLQAALQVAAYIAVFSTCYLMFDLKVLLKGKLKASVQEAKEKDLEIHKLMDKVQKLQAGSTEHSRTIRDLRTKVAERDLSITELNIQLRWFRDRTRQLERTNSEYREEIAQKNERLAEYHDD
ncbi:hypothetical protein NMY22_g17315 [Coprinellus aureogranulatus]|nr:hypothetical protein NMY22_g17315 [Coprinellus aureogranulatus]